MVNSFFLAFALEMAFYRHFGPHLDENQLSAKLRKSR